MQRFIVRRLLSAIPVLFIVSVAIFALLKMVPGSPAAALLGDLATEDDIAKLEERMGLTRPVVEQYFIWIGNMLHGDFGTSTARGEVVSSMVLSHVKPTISLSLYALLIASVIAIPMGMMAARNKGTGVDHSVSVISLMGISLPSFLFGLFLMLLFSVKLQLFPVAGYMELDRGLLPHIKSLTLPAISLGFMNAALMMRMTRSVMLEVLASDYIKMAKAKGVRNVVIIAKHALRNSMVTILTMIGQSAVQMISGAAVIESLFAIPGLGQLMVNSIGRRDYNVILAIVLLVALFNVLINMLVDLLYGVADPRVRAT